MTEAQFRAVFLTLTGNNPFPWQSALYQQFAAGDFPQSCNLPTGLGKTSVIPLWLIAWGENPALVPRRLVYVVNRRTVVDQSTEEAKKLRTNLPKLPELQAKVGELAISTLRGQFADNREWSADPSRPAVVVGTVDMIGSRLLFSGYGLGFKSKPLHAGFLGQDVLLVHDEAHLETPFQDLLEAIECTQRGGRFDNQRRCHDIGLGQPEFLPIRVMALTATPRGGDKPFELTNEEQNPPDVIPEGSEPLNEVWRRLTAKKGLTLVSVIDESQVVKRIVDLAWERGTKHPDCRVIVFVRTVNAVTDIEKGLHAKKVPTANVSTLTGTMRGLERTRQADPRQEGADLVFARFLKPPPASEERWTIESPKGSVYLICTAAGEVGVDISADHLVCDLTPFDSMAQRLGRVNRYGTGDARIDVVYEVKPNEKKKDDLFDQRRWLTLQQLRELGGDASPHRIAQLPLPTRIAAFTPTPTVLPVSDILFDAWALTTIREPLPGRPAVEPYLHGLSGELPETQVAWRDEVWELRHLFDLSQDRKLFEQFATELLDDYPLKPHELLRDRTDRVFKVVEQLGKEHADKVVWTIAADGSIRAQTIGKLLELGKEELNWITLVLPPPAGGLTKSGVLGTNNPSQFLDVADEWSDEQGRRRIRFWDNEATPEEVKSMRLLRTIDADPNADEKLTDETSARRYWHWYVRPRSADDDGSKTNSRAITWEDHTREVEREAKRLADALLTNHPELHSALILAARFHDLGKRRAIWQLGIGNDRYPERCYAKSGRLPNGNVLQPRSLNADYRHEFGSLLDTAGEEAFQALTNNLKELVLHLIATHHGRGRPHFNSGEAFDPERSDQNSVSIAAAVPQRFGSLQRKYGRWGLAYLESLLRAADYAASAHPTIWGE